jgi:protease I
MLRAHPLLEETGDLSHSRVAILTSEEFNDFEVKIPWRFLRTRGAEVTVIGDVVGEVNAHRGDRTITVEKKTQDVSYEDFDMLIIPGGYAPGNLRSDRDAVAFTREFVESGKPVAAICHGPELLVEAGVLDGRRVTSIGGISDQLVDAGGIYVNEPIVIDGNLVTSRWPNDLPDFCLTIAYILANQGAEPEPGG